MWRCFTIACHRGDMALLEGLRGILEGPLEYELADGLDIYVDNPARVAGLQGRLAVVQFLADFLERKGMVHLLGPGLVSACWAGHLNIVQVLVGRGVAHSDSMFTEACWGGHVAVAQFLFSLGGIDIHDEDDSAMVCVVEQGDLHVAKFLFELDPRPGAWPVHCMRAIQAWSAPRDAWMRSVVTLW